MKAREERGVQLKRRRVVGRWVGQRGGVEEVSKTTHVMSMLVGSTNPMSKLEERRESCRATGVSAVKSEGDGGDTHIGEVACSTPRELHSDQKLEVSESGGGSASESSVASGRSREEGGQGKSGNSPSPIAQICCRTVS